MYDVRRRQGRFIVHTKKQTIFIEVAPSIRKVPSVKHPGEKNTEHLYDYYRVPSYSIVPIHQPIIQITVVIFSKNLFKPKMIQMNFK